MGIEEHNLRQSQNKFLLDLLDIHFARVEQLVNNAYYKPQKIKDFYLLNNSDGNSSAMPLTDKERAIDTEFKAQAMKALTQARNSGFNALFSL